MANLQLLRLHGMLLQHKTGKCPTHDKIRLHETCFLCVYISLGCRPRESQFFLKLVLDSPKVSGSLSAAGTKDLAFDALVKVSKEMQEEQ